MADLMLSSESFASTSITVAPVTDAGRTYLAERGLRVHLGWGIASARPGDILDEEGVNSSEIPKGCSPEEKR